jgi:hypothetical protein
MVAALGSHRAPSSLGFAGPNGSSLAEPTAWALRVLSGENGQTGIGVLAKSENVFLSMTMLERCGR